MTTWTEEEIRNVLLLLSKSVSSCEDYPILSRKTNDSKELADKPTIDILTRMKVMDQQSDQCGKLFSKRSEIAIISKLTKVMNDFEFKQKTFEDLLKKYNVSFQSRKQRIKSLEDEVERLRRANAQLTELHSNLGSATIVLSKAEILEQVLFWTENKCRNDDLSVEQMKAKLVTQALKIKELTVKNKALETKFAGAKVTSSFFNKLAIYQKAIQDAQEIEKTEDLIEHILNAFEKGHVDVTLLLYQFGIVQFKFIQHIPSDEKHSSLFRFQSLVHDHQVLNLIPVVTRSTFWSITIKCNGT